MSVQASPTPIQVFASPDVVKEVSAFGDTVYYSTLATVSSTSYQGFLPHGGRVQITEPTWFVTAPDIGLQIPGSARLEVSETDQRDPGVLDHRVDTLEGATVSSAVLKAAAMDYENRLLGDISLSFYGAPASAKFVWPDGSYGTFVASETETFSFVDKVNAYTVTYRELTDTSATDLDDWRPVSGFAPLSDGEAAGRITRAPEIKSENVARNAYVPSDEELAAVLEHQWSITRGEPAPEENIYIRYVTGRPGLPSPTTDELIQWASHKWGIPTNALRAQMHLESQWSMDMLGDLATVSGADWLLYPAAAQLSNGTQVYQSMGLSQVKWSPDDELGPGADPLRYLSTAFNIDYCCAWIRFHLDDPEGRRTLWGDPEYVPHDFDVAQGGWYQPYPWRNSGQLGYVASVESRLTSQPWLLAEFSNVPGDVIAFSQPAITRSEGGYVLARPEMVAVTLDTPSAPSNLSATPGHTTVTLDWDAPTDDGGSAVVGYRIRETTYGWTVDTGSTAAGPYTLSGLTNGEPYTFAVAALNAMGAGDYSGAVATSPASASVPGAPTGVGGTAGNARVSLSWTAPASNGGSAITSYTITPYIGASAQTAIVTGTSAVTREVTGLVNGTTYTFTVKATNAVGTGTDSAASASLTPAAPVGFTVPPEAPIISAGLPVAASNEDFYAASRTVDTDRRTTWRSVYVPTALAPQWVAVNINGVAGADKTSVWCVIDNLTQPRFIPSPAALGSGGTSYAALMRNYKLQGHTSSSGTCPVDGDAGWVDLATVTDNRRSSRVHTGLDLHTYGWFKIRVTEASGAAGANDDVAFEFELRDVSDGAGDSILVYGDSISMESFGLQSPGADVWADNSIGPVIATTTSRVRPIITDYSTGGWTATDGDTNKAAYLSGMPHKVWVLAFGHNDAHAVNANMNTLSPSGVNSTAAQSYKTRLQSMVDYAITQGATRVVIPYITYTTNGDYDEPNTVILNTIIDQVVAANPDTVQLGPDFHTFFQTTPAQLRDTIHPTYSGGTLVNGRTGYENHHVLWADWLDANLYT